MLADPQRGRRRTSTQPFQVVDHALRRLVPVVRLLLQQMHADNGADTAGFTSAGGTGTRAR